MQEFVFYKQKSRIETFLTIRPFLLGSGYMVHIFYGETQVS